MRETTQQWGPSDTPQSIRLLIILTCSVSIFSALTNTLFVQWLGWTGPQELLSLSWYGLRNYFLWQPISYLFIQDASSQGINLSYLLSLFVNMYILWLLGSTLLERLGTRHFFILYLTSGVIAGLAALSVMPFMGYYVPLAGPAAALFAIFVVWAMCNPNSTILLFFLVPVQVKWLLASVLAAVFLIDLSQGDIVFLAFHFTGALYGYLYGLIILGLQSPFAVIQPFEKSISRMRKRVLTRSRPTSTSSKVVDIKSGEALLDDDAFVDAMLTKIAQRGERSLSSSERQRLDRISSQKKSQQP